MPDFVVGLLVSLACFACEVFLFSIGWNLGVHPVFGVRLITITESLGLMMFLKIAGFQLFRVNFRRSMA